MSPRSSSEPSASGSAKENLVDEDDPPPSLRNGLPLALWIALGFSVVCIAAGAAVAWLGPRLLH
jgi:hypothetical protein